MSSGPRPLRTRFALAVGAWLMVLLAGAGVLAYLGAERLLRAPLDEHLERDLDTAELALHLVDGSMAWRDVPPVRVGQHCAWLEVWPVAGSGEFVQPVLVWPAAPAGAAPAAGRPTLPAPMAAGVHSVRVDTRVWRVAVREARVTGFGRPMWLRSIRSEEPVRTALATLAWQLIGTIVLVALAGAAAAAWWSARALRPLAQLAQHMRQINVQQQLAARAGAVPGLQAAEVAAVAAEFQALLARLERSHGQLDHFAADCAHELRTPLTALRLRSERLWQQTNEPAQRRALGDIAEAADAMGMVVERLLLLARSVLDEPGLPLDEQALLPLVERAIEVIEPLADEAGVAVHLSGAALHARVDAVWLQQAVQDLLQNALTHAVPQAPGQPLQVSMVEVSDTDGQRWAHIEVADRGAGMQAQVLELLDLPPWPAERVSRLPRRRRRGGLGLRITHRLVSAQGGRLQLLPRDGGGTVARIVLPASGRSAPAG